MNSKLYRVAYKFLKARATKSGHDALKTLSDLNRTETDSVIKLLTYQH